MDQLNISFSEIDHESEARKLLMFTTTGEEDELPEELVVLMKSVWSDSGIQKALERLV